MHAAHFGAAVQLRENLAGIQEPLVVEGTFHAKLLIEIRLREHRRHEIALLDTHAVFAGEHAADLDAEAKNVVAEIFRALEFAFLVRIIKNERMQIAVASMKYVRDP